MIICNRKARNPNIEILNKFKCQNSNVKNCFEFWLLGFRYYLGFRISDLGFYFGFIENIICSF